MNIKKLVAGLAAICTLCIAGTALAAGPAEETETDPQAANMLVVSIEDITAVMEQLADYENDMDMLAQLVWAEARGIDSRAEQAGVIWCVLNRLDSGYWGDTISGVIRSRSQFAYSSGSPVTEDLRDLAQDVMTRWLLEKEGVRDVGRVLPSEYLYFSGRGGHNWFRKGYSSSEYWDWSLPDPYEELTAANPAA